jgi:ACR3 family arsenite transporter
MQKRMNVFDRFLSVWVALCMVAGVILGKLLPGTIHLLQQLEFGSGSHINIPIAVRNAD